MQLAQIPCARLALLTHLNLILTGGMFVALVAQRSGVGAGEFARQGARLLETDIGARDGGIGKSGYRHLQLIAVVRPRLDDAKVQGTGEARGGAGRLQTHFQTVHAHIALLYMPGYGIELWRIIRTHPGAVAAAEADIRVLQHRAVFSEFGIGAGGATGETHRIVAVIARHGEIEAMVIRPATALDITHGTERQMRR